MSVGRGIPQLLSTILNETESVEPENKDVILPDSKLIIYAQHPVVRS